MAKQKSSSRAVVADPGVAKMHAEHLRWKNEHALWRDELRVWQEELKQIAKELRKVEAVAKTREKTLRTHAAAFRLDDQTLAKHEHSLAQSIQGDDSVDAAALASSHRSHKAKQAARSREHAAIKREQHRFAARWRALMKSIG